MVMGVIQPAPLLTCVPGLAWPMSPTGPGLSDLLGGEIRAAAVPGWQHPRGSGVGGQHCLPETPHS